MESCKLMCCIQALLRKIERAGNISCLTRPPSAFSFTSKMTVLWSLVWPLFIHHFEINQVVNITQEDEETLSANTFVVVDGRLSNSKENWATLPHPKFGPSNSHNYFYVFSRHINIHIFFLNCKKKTYAKCAFSVPPETMECWGFQQPEVAIRFEYSIQYSTCS